MRQQASAFSPASVGNVGVGFDILGHVIEGVGDTVTVRRIEATDVRITGIHGATVDLPLDAPGNTAGAALISLREALALPFGFEVEIGKGIPWVPAWAVPPLRAWRPWSRPMPCSMRR